MSRQRRLPQLAPGLLDALLAAGVVWVTVGGMAGHAHLFVAGVWLVTLAIMVRLLLSRAPPREIVMLSEAEAKGLRAEVHAAMVARQYDLARAKLQELAQRSRGTWQGPSQVTPVVDDGPPARWGTGPRRFRQVATALLPSLIAAGVVLAGVAGLAGLEDHLRIFAAGGWLIMVGFGVTLGLVGWLLLRVD